MPSRIAAPVLSVDAANMHKVDTRNAENLFGMWTVFSKCAESIEEGRRLENLSWRLWNRETFCCASSEDSHSTTPAITVTPRNARPSDSSHASSSNGSNASNSSDSSNNDSNSSSSSMPELSASVDSASACDEDEQLDRRCPHSSPLDIAAHHPPMLLRMESFESRSRGREKHITSFVLEKMVTTIKEKKHLEPLVSPPPKAHAAAEEVLAQPPAIVKTIPITAAVEQKQKHSSPSLSLAPSSLPPGSQQSATSQHSIIRGFSPGQSSSYRSLMPPRPSRDTKAQHATADQQQQKKKNGIFLLGASSGEDESSLEEHMSFKGPRKSLTEVLRTQPTPPTPKRKQTSFKDEVATRTIKESTVDDDEVFTTDDSEEEEEEDVVSESAIDDDSDEWEDSVDENTGRPNNNNNSNNIDEKLFQRVDSRPVLASRPSLLTNLLHQSERQIALSTAATVAAAAAGHKSAPAHPRRRNHTPTGPCSPSDDDVLMMRGPDMSRTRAIAIPPAPPTLSPALSPRTTRRNMLATELTESLRRHLLWERQQKNTTVAAVLKRRHTAQDVSNLHDYPGQRRPVPKDAKEASKNNSWNHYFDHGLGEYHQKGW